MKKHFKYLAFALISILFVFTACKTENPVDTNAGKAKIENLKISPESTLKYGDVVTLSGNISDDAGLRAYTIKMSNASGTIFEVTKMLTGKSLTLNETLTIPLPKNATAGDMTLSVTVKNASDALITKDLVIKNLGLPVFNQLYILINNTAYPMKKNGTVFEVEDFFPVNAVGKIYTNTDKSGMAWGLEGTTIQSMGSSDITFGKATEEYFKITFNPLSFELKLGDIQTWNPMNESLYILGNISGHWADGEIDTEKAKMKMSGFTIGTQKMWTWTAPNTGTGDPIDDMWGNIVAGTFRFKKAGLEQYIVYSSGQIAMGADNIPASFVISAGGAYTIKVFSTDGTTVSKVRLTDGTKTLEYTNQGIFINGVLVVSTMTFASTTLNIVSGKYYEYDGTMTLSKDQVISAQGVDLTTAFCDPDVFSGKGNPNWTVIQTTGQYYVHIDAYSGNVYLRNEAGYPDAIYMDGWCWGKNETDSHSWNQSTMMTLYRKGTTNTYEGTLYILPWGGDVAFFAAPITNPDASKMEIYSKYFDGVTMSGNGLKLPVPAVSAFYKVSVDLKDGFTFDKVNMDGTNYTIVPTNNKKFAVTFTAL